LGNSTVDGRRPRYHKTTDGGIEEFWLTRKQAIYMCTQAGRRSIIASLLSRPYFPFRIGGPRRVPIRSGTGLVSKQSSGPSIGS
jgi:hypothetical protein